MNIVRWTRILLLACVVTAGLTTGIAAAAPTGVSIAMVLGNEIYVSNGGGGFVQLTADRVPKSYPQWSLDGERIAFVEDTTPEAAVGKIVVIDRTGRPLASFLVHPAVAAGNVGIRYIEGVAWVTNQRIVVSGSVNPATTEYDVFNAITGQQLGQFTDDGLGAAFTADGRHYAYVKRQPHFNITRGQTDILQIDGTSVFPEGQRQVNFVTPLQWSPDNRSLAVIATDTDGPANYLVWWQAGAGATVIQIPFDHDSIGSLFWNGGNLFLSVQAAPPPTSPQIWEVIDRRTLVPADAPPATPALLDSSEQLNEQLQQRVAAAGGTQASFWCLDCVLAALPHQPPPGG